MFIGGCVLVFIGALKWAAERKFYKDLSRGRDMIAS